jgi:5-formyltetrahydrofolate cyclo-ligase
MTTKTSLRATALARRDGQDPALGAALVAPVLDACPPAPGAVVGGFLPIHNEIDPRPLLAALAARGHRLVLPETPPKGAALIFRRWTPGDPLVRGRFGTLHPAGEELRPDYLLVPLLAFDRAGHRLGYGGGYYDRTLAALPAAFRLGIAFAAQEMQALPAEPHDIRLHAVATETDIIFF